MSAGIYVWQEKDRVAAAWHDLFVMEWLTRQRFGEFDATSWEQKGQVMFPKAKRGYHKPAIVRMFEQEVEKIPGSKWWWEPSAWARVKWRFVSRVVERARLGDEQARRNWQELLLKVHFLSRGWSWVEDGERILSQPMVWPKKWNKVKTWPCQVGSQLMKLPLKDCHVPVFWLQRVASSLMEALPEDLVWLVLRWS